MLLLGKIEQQKQSMGLLRRLENGVVPNTREVVGYFGKDARFEV